MLQSKPGRDSAIESLLSQNLQCLAEAEALLNELPAQHFAAESAPAFESTIGAHMRHVLEHYDCFLQQLRGGTLCYEARARDPRLERNRDLAIDKLRLLINQLRAGAFDSVPDGLQISSGQFDAGVPSTLARELLFLYEHSVHHFALIAAIARSLGHQPPAGFGVAIATLCNNEGGAVEPRLMPAANSRLQG
ncbi:MAG: hypothetical protein HKN50_03395 [Gammaproteobacteria bacterium]|nr:hypothetical protein [Gammaproteobacteria bacterium]